MNIQELLAYFQGMYGVNNEAYITGGLVNRLWIFFRMRCRLHDSVRKKAPREVLVRRVANAFSWFCACVNYFSGIDFAAALCKKYPHDRCGYCGNPPPCTTCIPEKRGEHVPGEVTDWQSRWTLGEWQDHFARLYGPANRKAGLSETFCRLDDELSEVSDLACAMADVHLGARELRDRFADELTDVFAWLVAVPVLLEIDVWDAINGAYGRGCPGCGEHPCGCKLLVMLDGKITKRIVAGSRPSK